MDTYNDLKRLSRITSILLQLQTRRIVNASELASRYAVSIRTIYRDIKVLEQIGVPIFTVEGKGYSLVEGYKIAPVVFTEEEANALLTASHLMNADANGPLNRSYQDALDKIKSVLNATTKDAMELLSTRVAISPFVKQIENNWLADIQRALTGFNVLTISYQSQENQSATKRQIEPFAFYYTSERHWTLIAYCRLRAEFRMFRIDRITTLQNTEETFEPHKLNLKAYLQEKEKNFNTPDKPLSP